jgi:hypothetical protein
LLEAEHSPPSSVEVKDTGTISPLSHTSSWRDAELIKHGVIFTLFLNVSPGNHVWLGILKHTDYSVFACVAELVVQTCNTFIGPIVRFFAFFFLPRIFHRPVFH